MTLRLNSACVTVPHRTPRSARRRRGRRGGRRSTRTRWPGCPARGTRCVPPVCGCGVCAGGHAAPVAGDPPRIAWGHCGARRQQRTAPPPRVDGGTCAPAADRRLRCSREHAGHPPAHGGGFAHAPADGRAAAELRHQPYAGRAADDAAGLCAAGKPPPPPLLLRCVPCWRGASIADLSLPPVCRRPPRRRPCSPCR